MNTNTGPIRGRVEALAQRLSQSVETVTRPSRIFVESSDVDDLNPPEDIDEFHDLYRELGIIRGNINQFVRDVAGPGVRVEAADADTQAYFTGEHPEEDSEVPDYAPAGGFLDNCAVIAGERNKPFYPYLKVSIVQKHTRGTALHEYLKSDDEKEDPEFQIQGFKHIRPESVSARVHANTNILLGPDEMADAKETTPRNEAAAYVQFDDQSIIGRRNDGLDEDAVPLSQNDVLKQTNNPDIGGDDATEDGVFGISPIEACSEDAEEYREIKRHRARAIKKKAWGVWSAQFNTEVTEAGNEIILEEWDSDEQTDWVNDVGELGPGDIVGHDGSIELDQWEPTLADVNPELQHLVDDILAALPAPKYATAHGEQITQHVTNEQSEAYTDLVHEERKAQERDWTQAFREVADRHPDLDPEGVRVKIAPPESSDPIAELDDEQIQKMEQFMSALDTGLGDVPVDMVLDIEEFLKLTMDLPKDVFVDGEVDVDESDPEAMADDLEAALAEAGD